jgi:hypothetical protein
MMWIGLASLFWGCGRNEDSPLDQVATQEPLLRFATVEGPAAQETQSYLVAFRQLLDNSRDHFTAFPTRIRTHMQALMRNFSRDLGPSQPRYLGSLNLTDLSHSFQPRAATFGPALLRQSPQDSTADGMASLVEVTFANDQEARTTLRKWLDEGRIYYAEPNGKSGMKGDLEDSIIDRFGGNQVLAPWLDQIAFIPAITQMGQLTSIEDPPVIAVMDSGVDVLHPKLRPAIYVNETGQNKLCKDDIFGCNTTVAKKENLGDGNVYPAGTTDFNQSCGEEGQCQHGTHVAGIIAARDADDYVGMCPYCQILVVKVVDLEKDGDETDFVIKDASIIAGLAYISGFKKKGEPLVRVINASFGKFERSRSVELFIKSLKSFGRGTLMVAAAGNEDTMRRQYPAGFDSVIAVSNVDSDPTAPSKSPSSNYGTWVDIAAPGDGACPDGSGIRSSVPGGYAKCKVGTSMSAPIVAGIAGLLLSKDPTLTADQVERRLLDTAEPDKLYSDSVNNGYRPNIQGMGLVPMLGSGVVNANLALDPTQDQSPPVTTQRSDLVRAGCGVAGGEATSLWSWFWLAMPLLLVGRRRWL